MKGFVIQPNQEWNSVEVLEYGDNKFSAYTTASNTNIFHSFELAYGYIPYDRAQILLKELYEITTECLKIQEIPYMVLFLDSVQYLVFCKNELQELVNVYLYILGSKNLILLKVIMEDF